MIKAIDFFCGAGGLTRGLMDAGIKVLAGVDHDAQLKDTYSRNNKPSRFIHEDINDLRISQLRRRVGIKRTDFTLYAACTPCQPFSTLSRRKGNDSRKTLLLVFARLVEECPPNIILVENVPGLNNRYGKEVYDEFINVLARCGYKEPASGLLDAKHFGVPQTRKRLILLASRHGTINLPTAETDSSQYPTVREYIEKYPDLADGEESRHCPNHITRKLKAHHKRIIQAVPKDGGSRRDVVDTSILLPCHRDKPNIHRDVFGRMAWDQPAPTLTSRCADVYCGRFAHPEQDRSISLREAAALQTFSDDYVFHGSSVAGVARQIGNAVPVKFAEAIGKCIMDSVMSGGETYEL